MIEYLVAFLLFVVAISLMLVALQFSRYKKRPSGCCGGGHCATDGEETVNEHSCYDEKTDFVKKYKTAKDR